MKIPDTTQALMDAIDRAAEKLRAQGVHSHIMMNEGGQRAILAVIEEAVTAERERLGRPRVPTKVNVLKLLDKRPHTTREVAREMRLSRTSTYDVLRDMFYLGLVTKDGPHPREEGGGREWLWAARKTR